MTRQEVIVRLCRLQREVWEAVIDPAFAADCFCCESGFWPEARRRGEDGEDLFRNDGKAIEWIERVVRAELARPHQRPGNDSGPDRCLLPKTPSGDQ